MEGCFTVEVCGNRALRVSKVPHCTITVDVCQNIAVLETYLDRALSVSKVLLRR